MKKMAANVLTILGGIWTALTGVLFLGTLLSLGTGDQVALTDPNQSATMALGWLTAFLVVGIAMLSSGLRLMSRR
jgi:uncharacterized membrane protein YraQ (UPF0718 family)